ncbi:MAG TPA: hypothetical protein VIG76_10170 [Amnibacterium sp.]|jgi:hypothetical protein|uniref:hypothetical protein n=1 Tax=Amnibacterium sp. TaxID=1872496 RepID=UPI002F92358E
MKNKVLFVAGVATGYVVGARAGRSAYTALAEKVRTARSSDAVRSAVGRVKAVAEDKIPGVTSAVSTVTETTASIAEAAASAADPEGDAGDGSQTASTESSAPESDAPAQKPAPKRSGRSRSSSPVSAVPGPDEADGTGPESAEEAAKVFEEQLPESGGAIDDSASSIATDAGAADESENPTATS